MFYYLIKIWIRLSLYLFCKRITLHNKELFNNKGPLLIGAHHPNSFLDAILVGSFMSMPVHFLTRSDVFKNQAIRFLLRQLQMIPVYRIRDGKEKLGLNESSFRQSRDALRKGQHVLIFVEGFCNYQTTLQPLKKGAARILLQSWKEGINVQIMPLWIRYNSFVCFGKEVDVMAGSPFDKQNLPDLTDNATNLQLINKRIEEQLLELSRINNDLTLVIKRRWFLFPFAIMGFLINAPFYFLVQPIVQKVTKNTIHYDSLLFCFLALFYPGWLLFLGFSGFLFYGWPGAVFFLISTPLLARVFVLWKK